MFIAFHLDKGIAIHVANCKPALYRAHHRRVGFHGALLSAAKCSPEQPISLGALSLSDESLWDMKQSVYLSITSDFQPKKQMGTVTISYFLVNLVKSPIDEVLRVMV